jgi:hypothetical protein
VRSRIDIYSKVIDVDSDNDNKKQPLAQSNRGTAGTVPSPFGGPHVYQNFRTLWLQNQTLPRSIMFVHLLLTLYCFNSWSSGAPVPPTLTGLCIVVKGSSNAEFQFIKGLWQRDFGRICSSHVVNHRFDFTPNLRTS